METSLRTKQATRQSTEGTQATTVVDPGASLTTEGTQATTVVDPGASLTTEGTQSLVFLVATVEDCKERAGEEKLLYDGFRWDELVKILPSFF